MKKSFKVLVFVSAAIFLNSCATFVKPGISKVKKIAIIAVQANKSIYRVNSKGEKVGSLTSLASGVEGLKEGGNPFIASLIEKAKQEFTKKLEMLPGKYRVVSDAAVTNSPAYQKFMKDFLSNSWVKMNSDLAKLSVQTLPGYEWLPSADMMAGKKDASAVLAKLAADLGVDAVAIVSLDIFYRDTAVVLGAGVADAVVKPYMLVVNKDGELAMSGNPGEGKAAPLGVVAGSVFLDKNTYPIFEKAIVATFEKMDKTARKELEKMK